MKKGKKVVVALAAVGVLGGMTVGMTMQAQARPVIGIVVDHGHNHRHHWEMQQALSNLQEARDNLESARHDFGGHRAKAQDSTNRAIDQVQQGLNYVDIHVHVNPARHGGRHPMLRDALTKLQAAHDELSSAKPEYDGHRQKALDATNRAISEVHRALDYRK